MSSDKTKKKKKKSKTKKPVELDLDMDTDDASQQTRFAAHVIKTPTEESKAFESPKKRNSVHKRTKSSVTGVVGLSALAEVSEDGSSIAAVSDGEEETKKEES